MGGSAVSSQRTRFVWIPIKCDHRTVGEKRRRDGGDKRVLERDTSDVLK